MRSLRSSLAAACGRVPVAFCCLLVAALPFGYYPDCPDSSRFEIGFGGGLGNVASVVRNCSGEIVQSEKNTFSDVGGSAFVRFPIEGESHLVFGVRGAYWRSGDRLFGYGPDTVRAYADFSYWNPCVSIESRGFGFGLGWLRGRVPLTDEDLWTFVQEQDHVTGHFRLGNPAKGCFIFSLGESMPLVSGGGYLTMGVGYPAGRRVQMLTGMSAMPYATVGLMQQAQFRLNEHVDVDISVRGSDAKGVFEAAFSASVLFRFGK